jgi:hypothetical protein
MSRKASTRITPEMIAMFRRAVAIQAAGLDQIWEQDGGRRREFLDAESALDRLLDLELFETNPLAARREEPPRWMKEAAMIADWRRAYQLHLRLMELSDDLRTI